MERDPERSNRPGWKLYVLLGSTRNEGVSLDLFTTTETRWLEVEIDQVKQPHILLGSVPYALKAADAETLGGMPVSVPAEAATYSQRSARSRPTPCRGSN